MKRYVPLRDWSCPSYDPETGRAAPSTESRPRATTIEGQRISPNAQFPAGQPGEGSPTLKELDAARTQNRTPVRKRPVG